MDHGRTRRHRRPVGQSVDSNFRRQILDWKKPAHCTRFFLWRCCGPCWRFGAGTGAMRSSFALFSMGGPLFLGCFFLSWHSHVQPNWIAPSVIPLFCLMAIYWSKRWERYAALLQPLLAFGLAFGVILIVVLHEPNLVNKMLHRRLPPKYDLLRRAAWLEGNGPHRWPGAAGIGGGRRAGVYYLPNIMDSRRSFPFTCRRPNARSTGRTAGLFPRRLPSAEPILLLAELSPTLRAECTFCARDFRPGPSPRLVLALVESES